MTRPPASLMTLAAAIALLAFGGPSNAAPTAPRAHIPHSSDPNYRRLLKIYADNPAVPLDAQVVQGHRTTDSRRFHVIFHGADAKPIPATYFEYIRASAWHPVPAIILIHGISRGSDEMQQFGFFLAATGYAVLVVDESERLDTARSTDQIVVGLRRSVTDIRRAVDFLRTQPHVNPGRLSVFGFGLGGVAAGDAAAVDYRIRAAILVSTGGGLGGILQRSTGSAGPPSAELAAAARDLDPSRLARYIAPHPILMINGKLDTVVPPPSAAALYNAAAAAPKSKVKIVWIPQAGHKIGLDLVYDNLARFWLRKYL